MSDPRRGRALARALPGACAGASGSPAHAARIKPLALLVGLALAQMALAPARADSGNGVDTTLGNAQNPTGMSSARPKDPDGLGQGNHSRTPTGFLYVDPWLFPTPNKTDTGWSLNGSVEVGGLKVAGDKQAAKFREYKDLDTGAYLNNFWVVAEKPDQAWFVEALGGGVAHDDQYYGLNFGHYNAWKVRGFYNETPHVFTSTYRNLYSGTGSPVLTLNPPLTAGPLAPATAATVSAAVVNAVQATPFSTIKLEREKSGFRADFVLPNDFNAYASYTNEHRVGARPFGMVFGGGGSAASVEITEPIDYNTHDFLAGLQWSNERTSANLQTSVSLFRNHIDTLTAENPWFLPLVAPAVGATSVVQVRNGQFDLYPDNEAYNVKAEVAHAIPEFYRTRVTGVLGITSTRQNDSLIPSTPNGDVVVNTSPIPGQWNTTASLSKPRAGARIDSRLLDLGLSMNPVNALDVKAKLRHYETSNHEEYWACNPLTGQWGRLINNASQGNTAVFASPNLTAGNNPAGTSTLAYDAAGCNIAAVRALNLVPNVGNATIRNTPYEYKQDNIAIGGDYAVAARQSVNLNLEREIFRREHRERDRTWEDKVKLGYVNRALAGGTLRASLEGARRRGTDYHSDPYDEFYSSSLGPLPTATGTNVTSWIHTNDLHRKFDLADRDTTTLNLRYNHALGDDLDLGVSATLKDLKYPAAYGRNGHMRNNAVNAELNWQPAPEFSINGFAALQLGHVSQAGNNSGACVIGTTYYFRSDGSVGAGPAAAALTAAQIAAGITTLGTTTITAANWQQVCGGGTSDFNPLYTSSRTWRVAQDDRNIVAGVGLRKDFAKAKLELNYSYSLGRTRFRYSYNPYALGTSGLVSGVAPNAAQQLVLDLIGNGLPDQQIKTNVLDGSLLVPVNKSLAVRLLLHYETQKIRDPHYDGVFGNPVPLNNYVYLDTGPQNYRVTAIGVLLQFTF